MPLALRSRFTAVLPLVVPILAILAARIATHSDLAARHPRTAALLFLWVAADALALALIAKAPRNRPGLRALLGAIAAGCVIATLGAAAPVRAALLDMRALVIAMALTGSVYICWSVARAAAVYRRTRNFEAAASEVLPARVVQLAVHEIAMLRLALFRWGARPDIPDGARGFAYHRVINPMIAAFLVLQAIEIVVVDLLVSHWSERAALVLLALGVWGLLFLVSLMKAFRLNPVLLDDGTLRIRAGTVIDISVPLRRIAVIEPSISDQECKRPDVLDAAILSHPNIVLRLDEPMAHRGFLGRGRMIDRVAFRLDDPGPFLDLLEERLSVRSA